MKNVFLPFKSFEKAIQALTKSKKKPKFFFGQSFFFQSKKKLKTKNLNNAIIFFPQKVALLPK